MTDKSSALAQFVLPICQGQSIRACLSDESLDNYFINSFLISND